MILLFVMMLVIAMAMSRLRTKYVTPAVIFTGVWLLMVVLYETDPLQMFTYRIPAHVHGFRLASLASFLGGTAVVWLFRPRSPIAAFTAPRLLRPVTWLLLLGFAICTLWRVGIVLQAYGNVATAMSRVRDDFVSGVLQFPRITSLGTVFANLIALNLGLLIGLRRPPAVTTVLFIVLAIVNDATAGDKGGMRLVIFMALTAYFARVLLLRQPFRGHVKYALFATAAFLLYSTITYFRVRDGTVSVYDVTLPHFYGDIVGNIGSSAWFFDHPWPADSFGLYSFPGFYGLLGVPGIGMPYFVFAAIDVNARYNTTDYFYYLDADFGLWGVMFVSVVMGAVSAWLFLRAKYTRTFGVVQSLAIIASGFVFSVRGFYFGAPGFWATLFLVIAQSMLLRAIRSRRRVKATPAQGEMGAPAVIF